jgi:predicted RNA binding protein YcfA (HicA-like mRNA interferase family)
LTKVPSLNYPQIIRAFQRGGWTVVSQKGSHIKLENGSLTIISGVKWGQSFTFHFLSTLENLPGVQKVKSEALTPLEVDFPSSPV